MIGGRKISPSSAPLQSPKCEEGVSPCLAKLMPLTVSPAIPGWEGKHGASEVMPPTALCIFTSPCAKTVAAYCADLPRGLGLMN